MRSEKTTAEAKARYDRLVAQKQAKVIADEDLRAGKLTWERYVEEIASRKGELQIAVLQRQSAATIVRMYEIRSPVSGTIRKILKKRGEAVKALETVFQIEIPEEK